MTELYLLEYLYWNYGSRWEDVDSWPRWIEDLHSRHLDDELLRPSVFTQEAVLEVWPEAQIIGNRALVPVNP